MKIFQTIFSFITNLRHFDSWLLLTLSLLILWWQPSPCPHRVNLLSASDVVPGGCTMTTVGASCQIHLQLKGLVDITREVTIATQLPYILLTKAQQTRSNFIVHNLLHATKLLHVRSFVVWFPVACSKLQGIPSNILYTTKLHRVCWA